MDSAPAPTSCPSPSKPNDVRPKRQRTPEQTTSKTQKQARHNTSQPAYEFEVVSSEKDHEIIPTKIPADWTRDEIIKRPEFELKVHV